VKLFVHPDEFLLINMSINLCSADVGMPEHFLDYAEVGPVFEKVARE
jgi:hypothetical protein